MGPAAAYESIALGEEAEADDLLSDAGIGPEPSQALSPMAAPSTSPSPAPVLSPPAEAVGAAERFVECLLAGEFAEILEIMVDGYDFYNGDFFTGVCFPAYSALSSYEITEFTFDGSECRVSFSVRRPYINALIREHSDIYFGSDDYADWVSQEDFFLAAFEAGEYEVENGVYTVSMLEQSGEWKFALDQSMLALINENFCNPFAASNFFSKGVSREESLRYIEDHISLLLEGDNATIINNGDKSVMSVVLKLEYIDASGRLLRTSYHDAFDNYAFYSIRGLYDMKPGYIWSDSKSSMLSNRDEIGASIDKCRVSVFDMQYENATKWPSLTEEKQIYCESYISFTGIVIEHAFTGLWGGQGITSIKIANTGANAVSKLVVLAEFPDSDGTVRSAAAFNVVIDGDSPIDPNGAFELIGRQFFPLYHVPASLAQNGLVRFRVIEIEF
ncbi:MAG: hypothetical protein FWF03_05290 [Defluviitaleaceae bacterium]|nr:hypothetical protein [Defluviitaleaceae bacterium]